MDASEYDYNLKGSPHYKKAKKKVDKIKKFYKKLYSYLLISAFLLGINLFTWPGFLWAFFPIMGMGLGLGLYYVKHFGVPFSGLFNPDWEERKLRQELAKLEQEDIKDDWDYKSSKQEDFDFNLDQEIELEENFEKLKRDFDEGFN